MPPKIGTSTSSCRLEDHLRNIQSINPFIICRNLYQYSSGKKELYAILGCERKNVAGKNKAYVRAIRALLHPNYPGATAEETPSQWYQQLIAKKECMNYPIQYQNSNPI